MRSVQRILAIFESFTADKNALTLHELTECVDLPKSTTFRIIHSLVKAGYLVRLEDQQYCLSFRFKRLAGLVQSTLGIRVLARPFMLTLAEQTGETVSLQMAQNNQRVCIDAVSTVVGLLNVTQPGEHTSLVHGASSKMLLAQFSETQAASVVAEMADHNQRPATAIWQELAHIRDQGYAYSHAERLLGVSAYAAPILGVDAAHPYCLSVAGPTARMQGRQEQLLALTMEAAAGISRQAGAELQIQNMALGHKAPVKK